MWWRGGGMGMRVLLGFYRGMLCRIGSWVGLWGV